MRVNYLKNLMLIGFAGLFISCGSTPKNEFAKEPQAPKVIKVKLLPEENAFLEKLNNIVITVEKAPKETSINKAFVSPFAVKVMNGENVEADYKLKVSYCNDGETKTEIVSTDKKGICSFEPEVPVCGANTYLSFEPYFDSNNSIITTACQNKKVNIPYKVKGKIFDKGAILFVWDYNEKDRAVNNSYDILSEMRGRGIWMCGNAPVCETTYFDKPLSVVYKKNKDIVGGMYGFLITGQIKFIKPVELVENEYLCSLIAEINVIDMSNGEVAFTDTFTNDALGSNWTKCVTKCKKELAAKIIDSIIYNSKL